MSLGNLKTRIENEINRSDLDNEIDDAVRSAIHFYSAESLWFQEERSSANTVAGQEYYALPDDFVSLDSLRITINSNNDYPLIQRSNQYFERTYQPSSVFTGYPQDWTIYDQQLRLGPIPNDAFPLTLHYISVQPTLGDDTDSNTYTETLLEIMIRSRAKWDLYVHVIRDYPSAQQMKAAESEAYAQVRKRSNQFDSNTVIPRYL